MTLTEIEKDAVQAAVRAARGLQPDMRKVFVNQMQFEMAHGESISNAAKATVLTSYVAFAAQADMFKNIISRGGRHLPPEEQDKTDRLLKEAREELALQLEEEYSAILKGDL